MPPAIPWAEIRARYVSGENPRVLAESYGLKLSNIRKRIYREKWSVTPARIVGDVKPAVDAAMQKLIKTELTKHRGTIREQAKAAIAKCEEQSLAMAEEFVSKARLKLREAEGKDLSSVATLGRTGVDIWRTTLGLTSTNGSTAGNSAININFLLKGNLPASPVLGVSGDSLGQSHETSPIDI